MKHAAALLAVAASILLFGCLQIDNYKHITTGTDNEIKNNSTTNKITDNRTTIITEPTLGSNSMPVLIPTPVEGTHAENNTLGAPAGSGEMPPGSVLTPTPTPLPTPLPTPIQDLDGQCNAWNDPGKQASIYNNTYCVVFFHGSPYYSVNVSGNAINISTDWQALAIESIRYWSLLPDISFLVASNSTQEGRIELSCSSISLNKTYDLMATLNKTYGIPSQKYFYPYTPDPNMFANAVVPVPPQAFHLIGNETIDDWSQNCTLSSKSNETTATFYIIYNARTKYSTYLSTLNNTSDLTK